jgi:thiamine biosynthesis protein ThiS
MEIFVNGEREIVEPCSIADLVAARGLNPAGLVVERNRAILKQDQWPTTRIQAGDRLELLNFVGGG